MPCNTQKARLDDKRADLARADAKYDKLIKDTIAAGVALVILGAAAGATAGGFGFTAAAAVTAAAAFVYNATATEQAIDEYGIASFAEVDADQDYAYCLRGCQFAH